MKILMDVLTDQSYRKWRKGRSCCFHQPLPALITLYGRQQRALRNPINSDISVFPDEVVLPWPSRVDP
jgi:hypothetical protein